MALVSKFGFTNETASANKITLTSLKLMDNYALTEDEPTQVRLSNVTAPIDEPEVATFGCINVADVSSSIKNLHPPKVKGGIQYQLKLEELLTTTSSEDAEFRVDEPIVAYLTIRHPRSSNISITIVEKVVNRLLSTLYKEDGTTRLPELIRSALKPTAN